MWSIAKTISRLRWPLSAGVARKFLARFAMAGGGELI